MSQSGDIAGCGVAGLLQQYLRQRRVSMPEKELLNSELMDNGISR
jgi:hypothetical protein